MQNCASGSALGEIEDVWFERGCGKRDQPAAAQNSFRLADNFHFDPGKCTAALFLKKGRPVAMNIADHNRAGLRIYRQKKPYYFEVDDATSNYSNAGRIRGIG